MKKLILFGMILFMSFPTFSQRGKSNPTSVPQFDAELYQGLKWRNIGPFRGGRSNAVSGVPNNDQVFFVKVQIDNKTETLKLLKTNN